MDYLTTAWILTGLIAHFYWWDRLTNGKWDGPAIPLCLLSTIGPAMLGPFTFLFEWWIYWLCGPHEHDTPHV